MTPREISKEEVQNRLEEAVQEFDWIGEFLGDKKDEFLRMYMAFHAQLREGDKLEIEVSKDTHEGKYTKDKGGYTKEDYPIFNIILHQEHSMRLKRVWSQSLYAGHGVCVGLLYEDVE